MADKDFRVKNRLHVNGLSQTSGVILATNNALDSHTNVPTQYGGTGTTTSPNAGQILYSSAGTNYTPTDLSSLTISNTGGSTITASSASVKGLIIKGAASQTANLQEWRNSDNVLLAYIDPTYGRFVGDWVDVTVARTEYLVNKADNGPYVLTSPTNIKIINRNSASNNPLIIQGMASQTGDLQQWQNSSGTVLSAITSAGNLVIGRSNNLGAASFTIQGVTPISLYSQDNTTALHSRIIFLRGNTVGNVMAITSKGDTANGVGAIVITNGVFTNELAGFGYNGNIYTNIQTATTVGLTVKGASSQTANLTEWQTSSGSIIAKIDSNGVFNASAYDFGNNTGYPQIVFGGINTTATIRREYRSSISKFGISTGTFHFGSNPDNSNFAITDNQVGVFGNNTGLTTFTVKAAASQTANLTEWQNSSGTALAYIDSTGRFLSTRPFRTDDVITAGSQTSTLGQISAISSSSTRIGLVVRGAASQTANLQEWQDSAGTVYAFINPYGQLSIGQFPTIYSNARISLNTVAASVVGMVIRGVASQTGDLQQWQNSSGTVLASISAAGNLTVQDLTVNGTTTTINSTTLTVDDKNIELASVASPTDTTADGAGITIKGATDKTFNWVQSTGAFTSSEPISAPGISITGNSVSSNITLVSGKRYFVDTSAARTLTLPASPSLGDEIQVFDASGTAATNNMTINRNGGKINGVSDDLLIDVNGAAATLVYTGSTYGWVVK